MPQRIKSLIRRYREELIGLCFVLSLFTATGTVMLFVRQTKLLNGMKTTVNSNVVQESNQRKMLNGDRIRELKQDSIMVSLKRKLDEINKKQKRSKAQRKPFKKDHGRRLL